MKEKILVTGGAGFIGAHVAGRLSKLGYAVVVVDNFNPYYDPKLKRDRIKALLSKRVSVCKIDIADYRALKTIFANHKFDKICHLAAQAGVRYSIENPFVYETSNLKGTLNLLQLSIDFKIKGFIFASSSSVYGESKTIPFSESQPTDEPVSLYAATKKAGELLAHSYHAVHKLRATGLRFFTVYGPWGRPDMALFKFTKNILLNRPIKIYNYGNMKRDFTYIEDIVDGVLKAIKKNYSWKILNLGSGNPIRLTSFIAIIEKTIGKKAKKKFLPLEKGDVHKTYASLSLTHKLLRWRPKTKLDQGVKNFVDWYRNYYRV